MNIIREIEVTLEDMAKAFAQSVDEDQAEFLDLVAEQFNTFKERSALNREGQILYMVSYMSNESKKWILDVADYINCEETNPA
jgi:hypothetical protein